jgi:hypothetical protein
MTMSRKPSLQKRYQDLQEWTATRPPPDKGFTWDDDDYARERALSLEDEAWEFGSFEADLLRSRGHKVDECAREQSNRAMRAMRDTLRRAFERYKLDPADPLSWRWLLVFYTTVDFGKPRRSPGRRRQSNQEFLQACKDVARQLQTKGERVSKARIARELAKDPRFRGKGIAASAGAAGLRKRLSKMPSLPWIETN